MVDAARSRAAQIALPVLLLCCAGFLLAPPAGALILPQRGIAGIKLNMTRAQIVTAKGKPDGERLVRNEIIGRQRMVRYGRTRALFGGFRRNARVVTINTRDPGERTRSGVGIGSTVGAVKRGVRGVRCRSQFRVHTCFRGRFRAGERVTVFDISPRGRVNLVLIGFVID
ncbi:MAG TPA: hypothetical protein VFZ41_05060 [Solirubrobacterales bacterium]